MLQHKAPAMMVSTTAEGGMVAGIMNWDRAFGARNEISTHMYSASDKMS